MPLVHPKHVVSFSSEDPNHPASNLLNRETFRKWKCKEVGEKEAYVILKFDKAVSFSCIDIGNDGSALVEVLVGRSGTGDPQFEVLLSSTAFMSPLDSREGKNMCAVKSFSTTFLSKPVAAQKWDIVKVQVSQPFNRHVQYGLTFIKFTSPPDPNEPEKIGMFALKKSIGGDDSDDDDIRPGRLFGSAMMKSSSGSSPKPSSSNLSTNTAIREASSKLMNAAKSSSEDKVKELLKKPKLDLPSSSPSSSAKKNPTSNSDITLSVNRKQLPDPPLRSIKNDTPKSSPTSSRSQSSTHSSSKGDKNKSSKKRALSPGSHSNGTSSPNPKPSSSQGSTPAKKQKQSTVRKTKPFNKLFEGVVFTISGYENPYRGQIRDKGVQMGGRYKADWDRSCTHLISAFVNTPKFRQVRSSGGGEIVKREWIEKSFEDRCRYPWRRYCLDRNDRGTESEEEVYADDVNDQEMDEEPIQNESEEADQEISTKGKRKRVLVMESSEDSENSNDSKNAYNADTDIDEDRTPDLSPSIMDPIDSGDSVVPIFEDSEFYICFSNPPAKNSQEELAKLESIITKRKGRVHKSLANTTEYYICHSFEWDEDFSDALSDNPNLVFIHEDWILECDKADKLVKKDPFVLSPN